MPKGKRICDRSLKGILKKNVVSLYFNAIEGLPRNMFSFEKNTRFEVGFLYSLYWPFQGTGIFEHH